MVRYYIAVIFFNISISALFYFVFRKWGLSLKSCLLTAGISVLTGLVFPTLVGYFNIYVVMLLGLAIVGTGIFYIVRNDGFLLPDVSLNQEESTLLIPEKEIISEVQEKVESKTNLKVEAEDNVKTLAIKETKRDETIKSSQNESEKLDFYKKKGKKKKQRNKKKNREVNLEPVQELVQELVEEPQEPVLVPEQITSDVSEEETVSLEPVSIEDNSDLRESYITRGFDAKAAGKLDLAIKYFTSALELEPPIDLAEMLEFDIYTMSREIGNYAKANENLENFLKIYSSVLPASDITEIKNQIQYTKILQELLEKANTPNLPFSKIPVLIKVSVDEKYNKLKSESFY